MSQLKHQIQKMPLPAFSTNPLQRKRVCIIYLYNLSLQILNAQPHSSTTRLAFVAGAAARLALAFVVVQAE